MMDDILQFYEDHKLGVWLLIIGIPSSVLIVGSVIVPEIFWDSFLWKYFWGPVVADAEDKTIGEISAGYNVINTVTYGVTLIVSFFGIFELIDYLEITIDKKFVYSLLPWIILGGSLRSLEDVGLFKGILIKLMISPSIYFVLGLSAIILMIIGAYLSRLKMDKDREIFLRVLVLLPIPVIYLFMKNYLRHSSVYLFIALLVVIVASILIGTKFFEFNEKYFFFTYGTASIGLSLSYNIHFIISAEGTHPLEMIFIPLMGIGATAVLLIFSRFIDRLSILGSDSEVYQTFRRPLNLLLCSAHLIDASSTYRGITAYGYSEKHVLPTYMIDLFGPAVIFVLKILLVVLIIYGLDVFLKEDFSESSELRILVKFVIIILGFAPAIRNTLRLAMGV